MFFLLFFCRFLTNFWADTALTNFWVFLIIAQNGVLTPESLSTGQCVAMPLKISFLQNKNISVVAKQGKNRISVPMSYMAKSGSWNIEKIKNKTWHNETKRTKRTQRNEPKRTNEKIQVWSRFEPIQVLTIFWVFPIIAQNGVLTRKSLSGGQCVANSLKISFLQNKNISVVAKQGKNRISVPM